MVKCSMKHTLSLFCTYLKTGVKMKKSNYIMVIPYRNINIVYNTLWNTSFITKMSHKDIVNSINGCLSLNENSDNDSDCFEFYKTYKFIVGEEIDEKAYIREKLYATNHDAELLDIIVVPTLACNFRCWYCYENHSDKTRISRNELGNIAKYVERRLDEDNRIKKVSVSFFGGEPFLCYDSVVLPLLEQAHSTCESRNISFTASATTNASLISEKRLAELKPLGWDLMQVTLDGNKNRHDKVRFSAQGKGSYDLIVTNVLMALRYGIRIILRINVSEETNLDVGQLLQSFRKLSEAERMLMTFQIQRVWQSPEEVDHTISEIVRKIRLAGFSCKSIYSIPPSIWNTCYADKENEIVVNPRGEIFKCTARDFSKGQVEGVLTTEGTIVWNELHEKRKSLSPLNIDVCSKCPILPICVGGCSQKLLEGEKNRCPQSLTDVGKIDYARKVYLEKVHV